MTISTLIRHIQDIEKDIQNYPFNAYRNKDFELFYALIKELKEFMDGDKTSKYVQDIPDDELIMFISVLAENNHIIFK